jgi:hypothetical protein
MSALTHKKNYGLTREIENLPIFKTLFGNDFTPTKYDYTHFDYYNNGVIFELKSLRYSYKQYTTAIIDDQKIRAINKYRSIVILYEYTEENDEKELYYIPYDKQLFDTFERKYDPNCSFNKFVIHIPITQLIKITTHEPITLSFPTNDEIQQKHYLGLISKDEYLANFYGKSKY